MVGGGEDEVLMWCGADTKSHPGVNPRGITPMGPIPHVESGYEKDWSNLRAGYVDVPE